MKKNIKIQLHKNSVPRFLPVFLTVLLVLSVFSLTAIAQIVRTKPPVVKPTPQVGQKTVVIKSRGVRQPRVETGQLNTLPPPNPLTLAEQTSLLTELMKENGFGQMPIVATPFLKFDARTTYVADKGWINFYNPSNVRAYDNNIFFEYGKKSQVTIGFKPERVGQWFLIDCRIDGGSPNYLDDTFTISTPNGDIKSKVTVVGKGHLQAVVIAQDTALQVVNIERPNGAWNLYSCEITSPN